MNKHKLDPLEAHEVMRFSAIHSKKRIRSTWTLCAIIVAIYLLEEIFGGSNNIAVLVSMGANAKSKVLAGEYYRLLSSVFLHAGLMHVFFNTYVLFVLGGFFNRILGEVRYLSIFFFSGFTGSLASSFLGKSQVSVGASGAIWGLFGASLAIAVFKTNLVPEVVRVRLRRVTLINLLINFAISFLPMIDFWGHIGGGIGGFTLTLLIVFSPSKKLANQLLSIVFVLFSFVGATLYALSFGYGIYKYTPWVNQLESELSTALLPSVSYAVSMPKGLKFNPSKSNTVRNSHYVFGDPQSDRLVIELHFFKDPLIEQISGDDWLGKQRDLLITETKVDAQVKKSVDLRDTKSGKILYFERVMKKENIIVRNYLTVKNDYLIKLGFYVSEDVSQLTVDKLANRIIASIEKK